jgi:hypothetical protein
MWAQATVPAGNLIVQHIYLISGAKVFGDRFEPCTQMISEYSLQCKVRIKKFLKDKNTRLNACYFFTIHLGHRMRSFYLSPELLRTFIDIF